MQKGLSPQSLQALELERLNKLQQSITEKLQKLQNQGYGDSLRQIVLNSVVRGEYDVAQFELERFIRERTDFPNFQSRVQRQKDYARDLIHAIEAKRNFPGLASLTLAKQEEMNERVSHHFEELKGHLTSIERQEKETRLEDIRSTSWVLKSLSWAVLVVFAVAFWLETDHWLGRTFVSVFEAQIQMLLDGLFSIFGW